MIIKAYVILKVLEVKMRSLVFMLCLLASVSSFARSGVYLAVRGGLSDVRETSQVDTHEAGTVPSAAVGVYSGPFRGEVEYAYQSSTDLVQDRFDNELLTVEFQRVMANGYVDLNVTRNVIPYLMAGAGMARHNVEVLKEKISGSNFAWNVGAGVGFRLTRNVTADVGARYVDLGKVEYDEGKKELTFDTVETYAGLRFMF